MRKLLMMIALAGAVVLAWRAWQQKQENARVWASATDHVR
jgi:predicted negative regulator of RcsB-dependent stress response